MKKLIFLLLLISKLSIAQTDTTKSLVIIQPQTQTIQPITLDKTEYKTGKTLAIVGITLTYVGFMSMYYLPNKNLDLIPFIGIPISLTGTLMVINSIKKDK